MDTKTRPVYMLYKRHPLQSSGHIQTVSEGMERDIPCKWKSKESWSSNTHNQEINTRRRYKNYKYLCTKNT